MSIAAVNIFYRAYGLTLASTVVIEALPALPVPPDNPDIYISAGARPAWVDQALASPSRRIIPLSRNGIAADSEFSLTEFEEGRYLQLSYADGSRFLLNQDSTLLWGEPGPDLGTKDFCVYLLGPVMGFVLRQKGRVALHASAVAMHERAVVLCGEAGAGKSTIAAALAMRGWPVLCEDVCALAEVEDETHVLPGYPRVCLWPDSVNMLFSTPDALPLIVGGWEKRYLPLDGVQASFAADGLPLSVVCLLAGGRSDEPQAPYLEPVSQSEAVLQLVRNTYMNWLLDRDQRAAEFDVLARLVSEVPCFRVTTSSNRTRLSDLTNLLESHAGNLCLAKSSKGQGKIASDV